jgi:two-component system LytT family response regulator
MIPDVIRTVIIDDDKEALFYLQDQLSLYPDVQLAGMASNYKRAQSLLANETIDLVFLDIEMPYKNGFELLRDVYNDKKAPFSVVFYTADEKYMIEALHVAAFDFLIKPIKQEKLKQVLDRFRERKNSANTMHNNLSHYHGYIGMPEIIALPTPTGLRFFDKNKILYFECVKSSLIKKPFWQAVLNDKTQIRLRKEISSKEILSVVGDSRFISISQSAIVNLLYVNFVEYKTRECILIPPYNDTSLSVSRIQLSKLRNTFDLL